MDVSKLLFARRDSNSKPKSRTDGFKVGLVIEGGGMRGIVSAGMLTALYDLGLGDSFDAVYGSSAGSINACYFLSGQPHFGTSIYYNEANTAGFISWLRLFVGKSPMQLDYMLHDVFLLKKYLDWETVINSDIELNVIVSSLERGSVTSIKTFTDRPALMQALKASSCIPWFAGDPVVINGEHMIDASFYDSIPYKFAVKDGCTHVLVLRTRPSGIIREQPSLLEKVVLDRYFKKYGRHHYDYYFNTRSDAYNKTTTALDTNIHDDDCKHACILSVALQNGTKVISQLEKRRKVLVKGAQDGYSCTMEAFGIDMKPIEVLAGYDSQGRLFCKVPFS